ncbi:MAG: PEP-CTERM sorting domain-containing protein [Roseibacillus sp.]
MPTFPSFNNLLRTRSLLPSLVFSLSSQAFAVTIGQLDNFSQGSQNLSLRTVEAQQSSMPLQNESLLQGWTRNLGIDANLIPEERSVTAEIAAEHGIFVLSYGPGVSARTWLDYQAPSGMTFDMTMSNAANCLGLLVEFSQAPFEIQISMESLGGLPETHVFRQEANYSRQQVDIPYDVFESIDMQNLTSLQVEVHNITGQGAPDIVISEVSVRAVNTQSIPEPSSLILIAISSFGVCLRRRREGL